MTLCEHSGSSSRGREVAVGIHFDLTMFKPEDLDKLFAAESLLRQIGVTFDTGSNGKTRDWEWDWSLNGPVKVSYKNFVDEDPQNRHVRAKQKLENGNIARVPKESERTEEALMVKELVRNIQGEPETH